MVQNRNTQQQGNNQRGGNQSRRVISLKTVAEETVAGGARRVLLQARVENGKRPFSGEPLVLITTRPTGASNQFGGFIEEATMLAHWTVTVPAGEEHTFQVTDGDGNISLPVTVSAKPPAQQKLKPNEFKVEALPLGGDQYELAVSVLTDGGLGVPDIPVAIRYVGVTGGDLTTGENGRCTHLVTIRGKSLDVTVECGVFPPWHRRLFSQAPTTTP